MSYCRNPHYIYQTGDGVEFDGTFISDSALNVQLYNVLLRNRRKELISRLKQGKLEDINKIDINFNPLPEDDPEIICDKKYQERNEDELIKNLLQNRS